jgi:hypothetical protein
MPPDQATSRAIAAQRKRDRALARAHAALRDLDRRDETIISFQAVARSGGSRANGSTSSPSCVPRSSACAPVIRPPLRACPTPSVLARRHFASATRPCWPRTAACATRSPNSRPNSPSPTANGAPRTEKPATDTMTRADALLAQTEPDSGGGAAGSTEAAAPGRARSRGWRPLLSMEGDSDDVAAPVPPEQQRAVASTETSATIAEHGGCRTSLRRTRWRFRSLRPGGGEVSSLAHNAFSHA